MSTIRQLIRQSLFRRLRPLVSLAGALLFFASVPSGLAQQSGGLIQVDKAFYVTGEVIWFKFWMPAKYVDQSTLIHVQIIRPTGIVADGFYLRVVEGGADGYYRVPYDWPPGVYRLRFSVTALEQGNLLELGMVELPIFNDLDQTVSSPGPMISRQPTAPGNQEGFSLSVALSPDRGMYRPRDSVRVAVEVRDVRGRLVQVQLAAAVTDQALCGPDVYPDKVLFAGQQQPEGQALDSLILLLGKVQDAEGQPFNSLFLTAWVRPLDSAIIVNGNLEGDFLALLPAFQGEGSVQLIDYKQDGIQARPDPAPVFPPASQLQYTKGILQYLELSRQRKKVYQLFDTLELTLVPEPPSSRAITREPDQQLVPGNYEAMENIPDFFQEVATPLKFRRHKKTFTAQMFNPDPDVRAFYGGPPVFIVDGRLTRDADFVAGLDIKDIETVDLYFNYARLRQWFGGIGRFGVVVIETKSKTVVLPESDLANFFPLTGLLPSAAFPEISVSKDDREHTPPSFRPQVFWAPSVQSDATGRATLSFPLGDDISRFRVFVTARTAEGALGVGKAEFEVKKDKG